MIDANMPPVNATVRDLGSARRRSRPAEKREPLEALAPAERSTVGRAWINGREVGGPDPRFLHLMLPYD